MTNSFKRFIEIKDSFNIVNLLHIYTYIYTYCMYIHN